VTCRPLIDGMTKCSRIARGFGCGSGTGFAAEERPKAGFGLRASAAFTVLKPIGCGNVIADDQRPSPSNVRQIREIGRAISWIIAVLCARAFNSYAPSGRGQMCRSGEPTMSFVTFHL
jgi:hypothetical protein